MTTTKTGRELSVIEGEYQVVAPLVSADEAMAKWNEYQSLVRKVINESDIQTFNEGGRSGRFIKKSGWAKLATYYGVSVTMVDERLFHKHDPATCLRVTAGDKFADVKDCGCAVVGARYVVRASVPNGRSVEAVGLATFNERNAKYTRVEHDLAGKAYTRAVNRAISAIIGAGEVSAEEKQDEIESSDALTPEQVRRYEDAWKMATDAHREQVQTLLKAQGFVAGQFRKHGRAHFDIVMDLLEGREMP